MKLIINERQLDIIANHIQEAGHQASVVKRVKTFLDDSYEPAIGTVKKGGEYHDENMIKNRVNNEMMSIGSLLEYLRYKFEGLGDDFLKQIIRDWFNGNLENNDNLSKNVKTTA